MARIINVASKTYASNVKHVFLASTMISILIITTIVYLTLFKPLTTGISAYLGLVSALILLLLITIGYPIVYTRSVNKYIEFKRMLERIKIDKDKIIVPSRARVSYGVLEAGRYRYGERSEKEVLSFEEKGIAGSGEVELRSLVAPYIYFSYESNIRKTASQFYILSNALKITEGENSIYLAILGPVDINVEKNVLSVRKDDDYAEAVIEKKNDKIYIKLKYNKNKSRAARLVLYTRSRDKLFDITKTIGELDVSGEKEFVLDLVIPKEIMILPLPDTKNAFHLLNIDNSWIKPVISKSYATYYMTGYENAVIRLVLDIPHARDIVDEARIRATVEQGLREL
ncbi:hypothetical protein J4526_06795 [Desulfurococcaceae archaeon MEX13E-LK6-19]|nr:hypothetical protein J4526_06795 [Desulfurococcaceae archaeon MEX13E-LK6-19]